MAVRLNSTRSYTAHIEGSGYFNPWMVPILPFSGGASPVLVLGEDRSAKSGDVH